MSETISLGGMGYTYGGIGQSYTGYLGRIEKITTSDPNIIGCAIVFKGNAVEIFRQLPSFSNNKIDFVPPRIESVFSTNTTDDYWIELNFYYGTGKVRTTYNLITDRLEYPLIFNNNKVKLNANEVFYWPLEEVVTDNKNCIGVRFCEPSIDPMFFNNINKWETIDNAHFNIQTEFGENNPITYSVRKKNISRNDVITNGLQIPYFNNGNKNRLDRTTYTYNLTSIGLRQWMCYANVTAGFTFSFKHSYKRLLGYPYIGYEYNGEPVIVTSVSETVYEVDYHELYLRYV